MAEDSSKINPDHGSYYIDDKGEMVKNEPDVPEDSLDYSDFFSDDDTIVAPPAPPRAEQPASKVQAWLDGPSREGSGKINRRDFFKATGVATLAVLGSNAVRRILGGTSTPKASQPKPPKASVGRGTTADKQRKPRELSAPQQPAQERGAEVGELKPQESQQEPQADLGPYKIFVIGEQERRPEISIPNFKALFKEFQKKGLEPLIAVQTVALSDLPAAQQEAVERNPREILRHMPAGDKEIAKWAIKLGLKARVLYANKSAKPGDALAIQQKNKDLEYQISYLDPAWVSGKKTPNKPANRLIIVITSAENMVDLKEQLEKAGHDVPKPLLLEKGRAIGEAGAAFVVNLIQDIFKLKPSSGSTAPDKTPTRSLPEEHGVTTPTPTKRDRIIDA
ncbi:MAG: hypothetical protein V1746_06885 [bacterium]